MSSVPKIEPKGDGGAIDTNVILAHLEKLQQQINTKAEQSDLNSLSVLV
jgi:hypothetical protein